MKQTLAMPAFGIVAAFALLLTGCGESAPGDGSTPTSSAGGVIDASIGTEFSGGQPGKADDGATPIKVGLINQEGGQVSNPEGSVAVQAAFDYINAEQGGIGGHPVQVEVCKVTSSEEEAQQCAQKFLNDDSISVILQGGLNVGAAAVHSTLDAAKPDVVIQANPLDIAAANTYVVNPSVMASLPGVTGYAKSKGYESITIVASDNPGDLAITQIAQNIFKGAGIDATVTTFPAGSTDLTSAYTAALADDPDAIAPIVVTTSGCIATAKALESLGSTTPVLGNYLCATQEIKDALGDFPKWAFESSVLSLFAPDETGQVDFYGAVMAKYAGSDAQLGINAPASFGASFVLAKVLNEAGPDNITPTSVADGLKNYTDGVLLYAPKIGFGSVPDMPALSGLADRFYTYEGDGDWTSTDWQNVAQ